MKKYNITTLLFVIFFMSSCNKKTDIIIEPKCKIEYFKSDFDIIGKWKWASSSISVYGDFFCEYLGTIDRDTVTNPTNFEIEFKSDGTLDCYRNDSLINTYFITEISYEDSTVNGKRCRFNIECAVDSYRITSLQNNYFKMSIPDLSFNNDLNTQQTSSHTFYRIP